MLHNNYLAALNPVNLNTPLVGPGPTVDINTGSTVLEKIVSNVIGILTIVGILYFAFQIIMAGYAMLSSEGDAKKFEQSRDRLIEACLGLFVVVIAIIIASLFATLLGISDPLNIDLLVRNLKF